MKFKPTIDSRRLLMGYLAWCPKHVDRTNISIDTEGCRFEPCHRLIFSHTWSNKYIVASPDQQLYNKIKFDNFISCLSSMKIIFNFYRFVSFFSVLNAVGQSLSRIRWNDQQQQRNSFIKTKGVWLFKP